MNANPPVFRHLVAVWVGVVGLLGGLLWLAQLSRGPLDDPDPARQRPGFLDAVGRPTPAPVVVTARRKRSLALCTWCALAVLIEIGLYRSYEGHDARFHWFTHFFVGARPAMSWRACRSPVAGRANGQLRG